METGECAPDRDIFGIDEEEVAELFYTSGTTALPKGVMLTHRNLYLHALEVSLALGIREEDTQLHTIPLFHVNGWGTPQFLTCLGGRHVLMKRFHPGDAYRLIQEHGVTFFFLVPTMAISLLNHSERDRYDTSSVRLINLGGAAANPRLVEQLEAAFDCRCVAGYGLTECSPVVTLSFPKSHLAVRGERRLALQSMTGCPIPGVELALLDGQGRSLPWNGSDLGEIAIRGDGVMKGYWGQGGAGGGGRELVPDRRPGHHRPGRLRSDRRSKEGHHRQRRREHLQPGSGTGASRPSRRPGMRRDTGSRRALG